MQDITLPKGHNPTVLSCSSYFPFRKSYISKMIAYFHISLWLRKNICVYGIWQEHVKHFSSYRSTASIIFLFWNMRIFKKKTFLFIMYLRTLILMTTCFRILMRKRYHTSIVCITRLLDRHLTVVLHKTSILNVNCHIIQACKWLHYMYYKYTFSSTSRLYHLFCGDVLHIFDSLYTN